jgi:hypothetical protein
MGNEIKITFQKAEGYTLVPATGAWGGVSPQGEIVFDLYIERRGLPELVVLDRQPDGTYKENESKKRDGPIVREAQVGVVLRPDLAFSIGKWLVQKAEQAGVKEVKEESLARH